MKTSIKFLAASALVFVFILVFSTQSGAAYTPTTKQSYSLHDDAGKYANFISSHQSIANPSLYSEWWYFEAKQSNIEFFTTIGYSNPDSIGTPGVGWITSGIATSTLRNDTIPIYATDMYDISTCAISGTTLNVKIDNAAHVVGINKDTILVAGKDANLGVSFALLFTRNIVPAPQYEIRLGPLPGDLMDHQAFMVGAHVTGVVIVNGVSYKINTVGYHDHQWGNPMIVNWTPFLGIYSSNFAVVGMSSPFAGDNGSYIDTYVNGAWHELGTPSVTDTADAIDPATGFIYPSLLSVNAQNDGLTLSLSIANNGAYWMEDAGIPGVVVEPFMKSMDALVTGNVMLHSKTIQSINQLASLEWTYMILS